MLSLATKGVLGSPLSLATVGILAGNNVSTTVEAELATWGVTGFDATALCNAIAAAQLGSVTFGGFDAEALCNAIAVAQLASYGVIGYDAFSGAIFEIPVFLNAAALLIPVPILAVPIAPVMVPLPVLPVIPSVTPFISVHLLKVNG